MTMYAYVIGPTLKHRCGRPRGIITSVNVVCIVDDTAGTVVWGPVIGGSAFIVSVGTNVPITSPEFVHVTMIFVVIGQLVMHVMSHPLVQVTPPIVIACIVIFACVNIIAARLYVDPAVAVKLPIVSTYPGMASL